MRRRIHQMQMTGMSDQDVVNNIVREEGAVALATPPTDNFGGILTWVMPGVALVIGFFIWSAYVRRNQKAPEVISDADRATIEKYRAEIDDELDEGPQTH
jgi:cytochrome c-type biogenesis protein CcmH/NrfF